MTSASEVDLRVRADLEASAIDNSGGVGSGGGGNNWVGGALMAMP